MQRRLEGDIDTIVLKALRKEPERRYHSAQELADDIDRHLKGLPVRARPDTVRYRTSKFVRRNRAIVASMCVVVLVLAASTVVVGALYARSVSAREAEVLARDRAERQAAKSKASLEYVVDLFRAVETYGRDITVDKLIDEAANELDVTGVSDPEVEAAIRDALGTSYLNLGMADRAEQQLEVAVRLRTTLLGADHADTLNSRHNLAMAYTWQAKYEDAEKIIREVVSSYERTSALNSRDGAKSLTGGGRVLADYGKFDEAKQWYNRALAIQRELLGETDPDTLVTLSGLAIIHERLGNFGEAEKLYRRVWVMRRKKWGERHPRVLVATDNLAVVLQDLGRIDEASTMYADLIPKARDTFGKDHAYTLAFMNNLARIY